MGGLAKDLSAPSVKRTNFKAPADETVSNDESRNSPRIVHKKLQISSMLGSKIAPKSVQHRSRRPARGHWRPKTHPRAANRDQKDAKSEPRAPQERREAIFTIFPAPGGNPILDPPSRPATSGRRFLGGRSPETAFSPGGCVDFLLFRGSSKKWPPLKLKQALANLNFFKVFL